MMIAEHDRSTCTLLFEGAAEGDRCNVRLVADSYGVVEAFRCWVPEALRFQCQHLVGKLAEISRKLETRRTSRTQRRQRSQWVEIVKAGQRIKGRFAECNPELWSRLSGILDDALKTPGFVPVFKIVLPSWPASWLSQVPWEFFHDGTSSRRSFMHFWGTKYKIQRELDGKYPILEGLSPLLFLIADPNMTREEAEAVEKTWRGAGHPVRLFTRSNHVEARQALINALNDKRVGIVHIACHCDCEDMGGANPQPRLRWGRETLFGPDDFGNCRKRCGQFIFLNTCGPSGAFQPVGLPQITSEFLISGASAALSPISEVNNAASGRASQFFYDMLRERKRSLLEALYLARKDLATDRWTPDLTLLLYLPIGDFHRYLRY